MIGMSDVTPLPPTNAFSEAAIFSRAVERSGAISPELARHILSMGISEADQQRVQALLEKNADGLLTDGEREELENLNHVADIISLWHSRARRALQES